MNRRMPRFLDTFMRLILKASITPYLNSARYLETAKGMIRCCRSSVIVDKGLLVRVKEAINYAKEKNNCSREQEREYSSSSSSMKNFPRNLPKRIIVMRHGESQGNLDMAAYTTTPDNRIPLTSKGLAQARATGEKIKEVVSESGRSSKWKIYFYVSPYDRTRSTLREIGRAFPRNKVIGVREECRIREQDFGNFQVEERMKVIKETRLRFGRFFYRFPEGESAADVFDRVASFMESLWRDIDMRRLDQEGNVDVNLVIVSHGLTARVFLMKWFKWTVDQFERLNNLDNCELRVLQLGPSGDYSLAIHHSTDELRRWGFSPEMIADQQWRATAGKGSWYENCPWHLDDFFGQPRDDTDDDSSDCSVTD